MSASSDPISSLFSTAGKSIGDVGNIVGDSLKYVTGDKAREAKRESKKIENETKKKIKEKKAEMKAGEDLEEARGEAVKKRGQALSQQKKKGSKGRRSTILTDNLGELGGEDNQGKKSLLGL